MFGYGLTMMMVLLGTKKIEIIVCRVDGSRLLDCGFQVAQVLVVGYDVAHDFSDQESQLLLSLFSPALPAVDISRGWEEDAPLPPPPAGSGE